MTVALSVFYPWVQLDCPGAPTPLLDDAIRRAAREFCKATHAISESVTIPTVATTSDYTPTLSTGSELLVILSLKRSATEFLTPQALVDIEAMAVKSATPMDYAVVETDPMTVRLYPTPIAVENLTASVVILPTRSATVVDGRLASWYLEGVTSYAKYWLQKQPNQPWSNDAAAADSYRHFDVMVADAKVRRSQQRVNADTTVQMRPLA